jgi:hypothetical protein
MVGFPLLEGPLTVLEGILVILVDLPFSEALLSLLVGLPFFDGRLTLFKILLPFEVGFPFLQGLINISKKYFPIVVGFSIMQGHLTITEVLLFTVSLSLLEGLFNFLEEFHPLLMSLLPCKDMSRSWRNFSLMERYLTLLDEIVHLVCLFPSWFNSYPSLTTPFTSWLDFISQCLKKSQEHIY